MVTSGVVNLIIFIALFAVILFVSPKLKINMGFTALLFSFLVGIFLCGMKGSKIVALFPSNLCVIFICATGFFGYIKRTGIFRNICSRFLWAFRNHPKLIPFVLLLAVVTISTLGCSNYATPAIMSPIAFEMSSIVGFHPLLASLAVVFGSTTGSLTPFSEKSPTRRAYVTEILGESAEAGAVDSGMWGMLIIWLILMVIDFTIVYFITKSYKTKVDKLENIEKPEPFTPMQRRSLYVMLGFIVFAAIPGIINLLLPNPITKWFTGHFEIYTLFLVGLFIMNSLGVTDAATVIKEEIPWGTILMVCGVGTYVALMEPLGCVEVISNWINGVPEWLVCPMMMLTTGTLAAFCNGTVAVQALFPVAVGAAAVFPDMNPVIFYAALSIGQSMTNASPFSTGGVMSMIGCQDNEVREKLVPKMFMHVVMYILIGMAFALLGIFKWFL